MKTRSLLLAVCLLSTVPLYALDWPQFRGPDRSDVSKEKGLLKDWPKGGPKLVWTFEKLGVGYSGPAVVGDRLYIMGGRADNGGKEAEFLICLDISGKPKELWAKPPRIGRLFTAGAWGDGPRGTPTVDGDRVYALGAQGNLICANTATGKILWQKSLPKDLGGKVMAYWGWCESPLIDGDKLVCTPGGAKGTVAALNKKTGAVIWRSTDLQEQATYGSIVPATIAGVKQYVLATFKGNGGSIVGVEAKTGKLLWSHPQPRFNTAVASTPIVHQNYVYLSAGYNAGCNLLKISRSGKKFKAQEVYKKAPIRRLMSNQHGGVVFYGGSIYGYSDKGYWLCQNLLTGKATWMERRKFGKGSLTCADGQLYLYSENDGTVVLIDASPKGWKEHGRFKIAKESQLRKDRPTLSNGGVWTHPVVANGRLYLRDQENLFCYDIKK
jgi:outer membrane protein assembly factor BamB